MRYLFAKVMALLCLLLFCAMVWTGLAGEYELTSWLAITSIVSLVILSAAVE